MQKVAELASLACSSLFQKSIRIFEEYYLPAFVPGIIIPCCMFAIFLSSSRRRRRRGEHVGCDRCFVE